VAQSLSNGSNNKKCVSNEQLDEKQQKQRREDWGDTTYRRLRNLCLFIFFLRFLITEDMVISSIALSSCIFSNCARTNIIRMTVSSTMKCG
jgi:hypothetical protein